MDVVGWYVGVCLGAFAIGFCSGLIHKALVQVVDVLT